MKFPSVSTKVARLTTVAAALSSSLRLQAVSADVVLSKSIMKLAHTSAILSNIAYDEPPDLSKYEDSAFYDEEPDQALIVKHNGYCFGAFRGTTLTWVDWQQNFDPHNKELCFSNKEGDCCTTRHGFYEAYDTSYVAQFEAKLRDCAKSCSNMDECVVLTGHSQGGAVAAVAALYFADLNPFVITFGQPSTVDAPCHRITSERWYRFINTKQNNVVGLLYDPVPFVPGLGAESFGHMLILTDDDTGVAYIGLDSQDVFGPLDVQNFHAHSMTRVGPDPGYIDRIEALMSHDTYPIRTTGCPGSATCTQDVECQSNMCRSENALPYRTCFMDLCSTDEECPETGRCDQGQCLPKLGSCMFCDEDSDCEGGKCLFFHCSGKNGLMDNECICKFSQDCASGRCEGFNPRKCEAQLGDGARCNENDDCKSGKCTWRFRCKGDGSTPTETKIAKLGSRKGNATKEETNNEASAAEETPAESPSEQPQEEPAQTTKEIPEETPSGEPEEKPTKKSKRRRIIKIVGIAVAAAVGMLLIVYGVVTYRKRAGYQTVSTN